MKASDGSIVLGHFTFTLKDVDLDTRLIIRSSGEHFALPGWNGCIAFNQFCCHSTQGFDAEGQGGDVEQQDVLHVAREYAPLNGCAESDDLVRVDSSMRIFAEQFFHQFLYLGYAGGTTDEDGFVNLSSIKPGIFKRLHAWILGAVDQVVHH